MSNNEEDKSSLSLVLDGQVSLVEVDKDGKETVTPIDSDVVLKCLLHCIEEGLDLLDQKTDKKGDDAT